MPEVKSYWNCCNTYKDILVTLTMTLEAILSCFPCQTFTFDFLLSSDHINYGVSQYMGGLAYFWKGSLACSPQSRLCGAISRKRPGNGRHLASLIHTGEGYCGWSKRTVVGSWNNIICFSKIITIDTPISPLLGQAIGYLFQSPYVVCVVV